MMKTRVREELERLELLVVIFVAHGGTVATAAATIADSATTARLSLRRCRIEPNAALRAAIRPFCAAQRPDKGVLIASSGRSSVG